MAMGKRTAKQQELFVATTELARSPGHPFYEKLNALLAEVGFDPWLETRCESHYKNENPQGRKSIPPGVYFRMILIGYFEGIDSENAIAWRCRDSFSLRSFLGIGPTEESPDRTSLGKTKKRLPIELFEEVFQFVLKIVVEKKLLSGKSVGVDSTTLEANAAMKSIVRRDSGEDWRAYITRLMKEEGLIAADDKPSDEDLRRFDKNRENKTVSNNDWVSKTDPEAAIARMKDGTTHLAYKAEHVVDLESDIILAATIHPANHGDMQTMVDSVIQAQANLDAVGCEQKIEEVAADKGYHSAANLELSDALDFRTYIPEPKRKRKCKHKHSCKCKRQASHFTEEELRAMQLNRDRMGRAKGKQLGRLRSEKVERSFAHVCDTGGGRRSWSRGLMNATKNYLLRVASHNLGRMMFKLFGIGKPRMIFSICDLAHTLQLAWLAMVRVVQLKIAPQQFYCAHSCRKIPSQSIWEIAV